MGGPGDPRARINFRVLGPVELTRADGQVLHRVLVQPKRVALLAYLTINDIGRLHHRDTLLGLFWPESSEKDARAALRQAVYFLRGSLGKDALVGNGEELGVDPARLWCDAIAFEGAFEAADFETAMDLYRGELLEGVHVSQVAPEFEFWLEGRRAHFRERALEATRRLAELALEEGQGFRAAEWSRCALALEPEDEDSLQQLITILETIGDRAGALRAYEEFEERLKTEYDIEPSAETQALVKEIRGRPQPAFRAMAIREALNEATQPERDKSRPRAPVDASGWSRSLRPAAALAVMALTAVGGVLMRHGDIIEVDTLPLTIAVMPFEVDGEGETEVWREGAVDLLSAQLDGILGLRAIDARTVLARWREEVPAGRTIGLPEILDLGRDLDARYVVLGRAVSDGEKTRLVAELYEVTSGQRLGTAVAIGDSDNLFPVVDSVAIDMMQLLYRVRGQGSGLARLADVTTHSMVALRAFLDGEVLFRRSAFAESVRAYQQAIEADSTFALAWYRLSMAYGYTSGVLAEPEQDPLEVALRYVDRLPEREALFLRTNRAFEEGTLESISLAEEAVRRYPDDTEAWYLLGEVYYHLGPPALVGPEESDRAFSRAIALDSLFMPAYIHMIHRAFNHHADAARATRLIEGFSRFEVGTIQDERNRLAFDIAFGAPTQRALALKAIDTLSADDLRHIALNYLWHPRHLNLQARVLETRRSTLSERDGTLATLFLYFNALQLRRADQARKLEDDPRLPARYRVAGTYLAREAGLTVPPERLEAILSLPARVESVDAVETFFQGAYAADRARWENHAIAVGRLRSLVDLAVTEGDTALAGFLDGAALGLQGYAEWRRGDLDSAFRDLDRAQHAAVGRSPQRWVINSTLRLWLGKLLMEGNHPEIARRYYASLVSDDLFSMLGTRLLAESTGQEGVSGILSATP